MAALALLIGLPLLSIPLYLRMGTPNFPDQPIAGRVAPGGDAEMAQALQRIELHLASNPNDARGFEVIAPAYMRLGRFQDAAFAYRRVIAISGETAERLSDLGEALIAAQNGIVSAEAKDAFLKAVALDPSFAKARFYIALAAEQDGDTTGAVQKLLDLSASLPKALARCVSRRNSIVSVPKERHRRAPPLGRRARQGAHCRRFLRMNVPRPSKAWSKVSPAGFRPKAEISRNGSASSRHVWC